MKPSTLIPFLRHNLDILFVGLNPAGGSSDRGHYFSVNQSLWNQLYDSGLITERIDKSEADVTVFGSTLINRNNWSYGITDLLPHIAESNSRVIKPSTQDCSRLKSEIVKYRPKTVILLHGKVLDSFLGYLGLDVPGANTGKLDRLIDGSESMFFNIAFPHGNGISSAEKVNRYREVIEFLEAVKQ